MVFISLGKGSTSRSLAFKANPLDRVWPFFWVYLILATVLDNARSRFDNCTSSFMIDLKYLLFFFPSLYPWSEKRAEGLKYRD